MTDISPIQIYNRIKTMLSHKNMKISDLEKIANLGNGTVRKWKYSIPSCDKILKVAEALGVSTDYLIYGDIHKDRICICDKLMFDLSVEQLNIIINIAKEFNKQNQNTIIQNKEVES